MRLALAEPPGRNSLTRPLTVTACPTETAPPTPVPKTRIASEVTFDPSPVASCSVKLFGRTAVTTPGNETIRPLSGEMWEAPWTW